MDGPSLTPGDRELLNAMAEAGTAMHRPREVGHFCFFDEKPRAVAASVEALSHDATLTSEIHETEAWVLRLSHTVALTEQYVAQMREWLTTVAEKHEGIYDGWDADSDEALDSRPN